MAHNGRHNADEVLAAALAGGRSVAEAAADAGVSVRTVHRRLDDAAFNVRVEEIRFHIVQTASGRLSTSMAKAADVLHELMEHADPNVRLRAAARVVDLGVKVYKRVQEELAVAILRAQLEDLVERVKRLNEKQA